MCRVICHWTGRVLFACASCHGADVHNLQPEAAGRVRKTAKNVNRAAHRQPQPPVPSLRMTPVAFCATANPPDGSALRTPERLRVAASAPFRPIESGKAKAAVPAIVVAERHRPSAKLGRTPGSVALPVVTGNFAMLKSGKVELTHPGGAIVCRLCLARRTGPGRMRLLSRAGDLKSCGPTSCDRITEAHGV